MQNAPRRTLRFCWFAAVLAALLAVACGAGEEARELGFDAAVDTASVPDAAVLPDTTTTPDTHDVAETSALPDATPDTALDMSSDVPFDFGPPCYPEPPAAAMFTAGVNADGTVLSPAGRMLDGPGERAEVLGFPARIVFHPEGTTAYVATMSRDDQRIFVLDPATQEVLQQLDQGEVGPGLAIAPDGSRLYASGGASGKLFSYDVGADGLLTPGSTADVGGFTSAVAVAPDGGVVWVGMLDFGRVSEVDAASMAELRRFLMPETVWDIAPVTSRNELYVSTLRGSDLAVVDLVSGEWVDSIVLPTGPAGMALSPDQGTLWVAVSASDSVAAVDVAARSVTAWAAVANEGPAGSEDAPFPNSNVNALAHDAERGWLYASRGADNAVTVLDAATLEWLGAFPTSWYPSDLAVAPDGATLAVAEGKGDGTGPSNGRGVKELLDGSVAFVDLSALDPEAEAAATAAHFERPLRSFPFECDGDFPVPVDIDRPSRIEHVVLIVKENKTFDCVFGDMEELDVDVDPALVRWGEEITPNMHALARRYSISDNFYTEVPNSDAGHMLLTATHLTEYAERIWLAGMRSDGFEGFQIADESVPTAGTFFTHLLDHGVDIRIYGEIVGMFTPSPNGSGSPVNYSDRSFPGGVFTNYNVKDEDKARYVAERIAAGELASFTYLLFPNDHTVGTAAGKPTPESMVADNDYAVGIVVDALSHSPFWPKTAVFIVQDDPQGCTDHVDAHRSALVVVSPWARRGHVSHVHGSFVSLFATFERIFGIPPLGRPDATALPLWDMFTPESDLSAFEALPRQVPEELNRSDAPGARASAAMDFRSPDRNPYLGVVLDAYRLWRMGRISREEAERRIADPALTEAQIEALVEESEEDTTAFDHAWRQYEQWLRARGEPLPR